MIDGAEWESKTELENRLLTLNFGTNIVNAPMTPVCQPDSVLESFRLEVE